MTAKRGPDAGNGKPGAGPSIPTLDPEARDFYVAALHALEAAEVPCLVGGAYAFARYAGITRHTKDFDVFLRQAHLDRAMAALARIGCDTELTFPYWLAKAFQGEYFIDLIFGAGNGVARVDDLWFAHASDDVVLGVPVKLCPAEEMIWSKAFILERERCDAADVAHLLRNRARQMDWRRLLDRFGPHWRVLFAHLSLFGFIYPAERRLIPDWVMKELAARLEADLAAAVPTDRICQGTLLSREQYLIDVQQWGYDDARIRPLGRMSREDVEHWTEAIDKTP